METSIFTEKSIKPTNEYLAAGIKSTYKYWLALRDFVFEKYPSAIEEWNFPGQKYGWNFRIKDKKRAIIYLLPRDGYFKVAFVFGQKAFNHILESAISAEIKTELQNTKVYAEGRGIHIDVKNEPVLKDIKSLVEIKLAF